MAPQRNASMARAPGGQRRAFGRPSIRENSGNARAGSTPLPDFGRVGHGAQQGAFTRPAARVRLNLIETCLSTLVRPLSTKGTFDVTYVG